MLPLIVMVSGNFDPFHYAHLDYIKQASNKGYLLVCVVSSDEQVIMKKGRVNEPEAERAIIVDLILRGLGCPSTVWVNHFDKGTTLVTEAIRHLRPDIFCRGTDKTLEDMPPEEKKVCDELGIKIVHVRGKIAHGSEFR